MKSYQRWIWQLPEWPALAFDAQRIQAPLAAARTSQGFLLGKAEAIGLEGLQPHIRESLTQEALTTSAIEGEKLDPESVRSSVARRLGLDTAGVPLREGRRNIEGLIDVLQDATLNTDAPLTLERLCSWHAALFPTGFSGMQRIDVGALRSVPMDGLVRAAVSILWFETLHPFDDGNGRLGRAILLQVRPSAQVCLNPAQASYSKAHVIDKQIGIGDSPR